MIWHEGLAFPDYALIEGLGPISALAVLAFGEFYGSTGPAERVRYF
jgi:hypothetical protein